MSTYDVDVSALRGSVATASSAEAVWAALRSRSPLPAGVWYLVFEDAPYLDPLMIQLGAGSVEWASLGRVLGARTLGWDDVSIETLVRWALGQPAPSRLSYTRSGVAAPAVGGAMGSALREVVRHGRAATLPSEVWDAWLAMLQRALAEGGLIDGHDEDAWHLPVLLANLTLTPASAGLLAQYFVRLAFRTNNEPVGVGAAKQLLALAAAEPMLRESILTGLLPDRPQDLLTGFSAGDGWQGVLRGAMEMTFETADAACVRLVASRVSSCAEDVMPMARRLLRGASVPLQTAFVEGLLQAPVREHRRLALLRQLATGHRGAVVHPEALIPLLMDADPEIRDYGAELAGRIAPGGRAATPEPRPARRRGA